MSAGPKLCGCGDFPTMQGETRCAWCAGESQMCQCRWCVRRRRHEKTRREVIAAKLADLDARYPPIRDCDDDWPAEDDRR